MILVDTSVWVKHLRRGDPRLVEFLDSGEVLCHPFIVGELACGHLRPRVAILDLLLALPSVGEVGHDEVLHFIEQHRLQGKGLGLIDMHLLAASAMEKRRLWTLDLRLERAASQIGVRGP